VGELERESSGEGQQCNSSRGELKLGISDLGIKNQDDFVLIIIMVSYPLITTLSPNHILRWFLITVLECVSSKTIFIVLITKMTPRHILRRISYNRRRMCVVEYPFCSIVTRLFNIWSNIFGIVFSDFVIWGY